jgi:ubiquinone/menaquinone biosynthesis C-methylase UbiE
MRDYQFWSSRYKQQASWTRQTRNFIINQISLPPQANILEVGCGSFAVLDEFAKLGHTTYGLDIDKQILMFSKQYSPNSRLINGDGFSLPVRTDFFDLCFCHFLLLWLNDPVSVLKEMKRVTRNSGWICCFAEPDYLSRIDAPLPLEKFGQIQNISLEKQGVNLSTGRNLSAWMKLANLENIHWGIIGAHQQAINQDNTTDFEWKTINKDVSELLSDKEITQFKQIDLTAKSQGIRILFIPTFYAYAQN